MKKEKYFFLQIWIEVKQMKVSHVVLLCLVMSAILSYTAATIRPWIQQDNDIIPKQKVALYNSLKNPSKGKPIIELGDPVEDPKPHKQ